MCKKNDEESKLYYLNSRYYDAEVGRFVNADSIEYLDSGSINGLNLYVYCGNNPIMMIDPDGHFPILAILGTLLVGTIIGGLSGGIAADATCQDFWVGFAGGAVSGLISTIGMGLAVTTGGLGGLAIAGGFGFASGFGGSIVQQGIENGWSNLTGENWKSARISGAISAVLNAFTFSLTNFAMRESVGLFDDIFDKSLKFGTRLGNSLSISGPALLATGIFSAPITIVNMIIDIVRAHENNKTRSVYNVKKIGFSY